MAPVKTRQHGMTHRTRLLILSGCMFLSGIAGLIYQVVWSRYLTLFIGSSGRAQTIILATFMGGLALGAWLFGRKADTTRTPLRLYASLEIGIGFLGVLYPVIFEPVRGLFLAIVRWLGLSPLTLDIAALVTCAMMILVPTTLMGGTLPVLGRYLIRNVNRIGRRIATLYYLNSFGAVLGSILAGFFLIRLFGLQLTIVLAAIINLFVASLCFVLIAMEERGFIEEPEEAEDLGTPIIRRETAAMRGPLPAGTIALIVIAVSGGVSFLYEIAWIRMLTLVLGSSSNSFALMLSAFIFGITVGSFILSRKKSDEGHFQILGWSLVGIGLTALVSVMCYNRLPLILNQWQNSFARTEHAYGAYAFVAFVICFLVMVAPTVFMGITVPAASRVVADEIQSLGRKVGNVFAVNTCGALIGAAVGGFVLLPWLGIKGMIEVAVALDIVLGLWVLFADGTKPRSAFLRAPVAAALCVLVPLVYVVAAPKWDVRILTSGTYRIRERLDDYEDFLRTIAGLDVTYYKDGRDASIAIVETDTPKGGRSTALVINGKADASTNLDMYTQMMVGHLPMMLHPNPENVLVVGFGSGVSIGAVSLYDTKLVECVELIPEVLESGVAFKDYNHDVLNNPNVKIIVQDAKTHLQTTPYQYDVIVSEPTNPWVVGVAGLFTIEYMETTKRKLRPGGLFVQWIQSYEIMDESFLSILRTFHEAYPYSTLFNLSATDVALVGSMEPFDPDFRRMEEIVEGPAFAADLKRFGIRGLLPILASQMVAKNRTPGPYALLGPINSDFFPTLEYEAQVGFFIGKPTNVPKAMDRRPLSPSQSGLWITRYKPETKPEESMFAEYFEAAKHFTSLYDNAPAAWVELWAEYYPDSVEMRIARARASNERSQKKLDLLSDPMLADNAEAMTGRMKVLFDGYLKSRSWARLPESAVLEQTARQVLEKKLSESALACMILGDLAHDKGSEREAAEYYRRGADLASGKSAEAKEQRARILVRLAGAFASLGEFEQARAALKEAGLPKNNISPIPLSAHIMECRIRQLEQVR